MTGVGMDISDNRYVSLTTFTRDGRRKSCPVWISNLEERGVGFTTESTSWKAKRISNNPRVELIASTSRGVPIEGSDVVTGVAYLVFDDEFEEVRAALKAKYGFQFLLIVFLGKIQELFGGGGFSSCGVVITVDSLHNPSS